MDNTSLHIALYFIERPWAEAFVKTGLKEHSKQNIQTTKVHMLLFLTVST